MTDTLAWDDHYPSAVHGMDGYDYVSCSCGWDSDKPNSGWPEHIRAMGADSLDAAWAEAEAALPEGWAMDAVSQTRGLGGDYHPGGEFLGEWIASAQHNMRGGRWARENAQGPTPAAALRALAAKLREREG